MSIAQVVKSSPFSLSGNPVLPLLVLNWTSFFDYDVKLLCLKPEPNVVHFLGSDFEHLFDHQLHPNFRPPPRPRFGGCPNLGTLIHCHFKTPFFTPYLRFWGGHFAWEPITSRGKVCAETKCLDGFWNRPFHDYHFNRCWSYHVCKY